jgi:hypothetical protein
MGWPQPYEGITGTDLTAYDLLSLDERAIAHRDTLLAMALHLNTATLVGNPAPVVERMSERIRNPRPGDLACAAEAMHRGPRADVDYRTKGLGVLLARRREYCESHQDWADLCLREGWNPLTEERMTDDAYYLQYGPEPGDICRWTNSAPVGLLTQPWSWTVDAAAERTETGAVFTRDSLLGALADSGLTLREPAPRPDAPRELEAGR